MKITQYLGDGEKTFSLTIPMIQELERKAGVGIAVVYRALAGMTFNLDYVFEIIRLGLIGGGTSPEDADALVKSYVEPRPIIEAYALALDILDARWSGLHPAAMKQADAPNDIAEAIDETMREAGL